MTRKLRRVGRSQLNRLIINANGSFHSSLYKTFTNTPHLDCVGDCFVATLLATTLTRDCFIARTTDTHDKHGSAGKLNLYLL